MGEEFFYCRTCGTRVTGSELLSGEARRTATQIRCADCLKKASTNTRRLLGIVEPTPAVPPN
jgi:DNA-directed RNA polymerase subunit RPC12/RpoP